MNPLGFVPRPRRPLEALDLGLGLLQAHARPVFAVFFLQVSIVLALVLPFTWRTPAWSLLWLWWLKPWLDRGTLHVLGRRVFGEEAGPLTFLGNLKAIHRRGLWAGLLWRRLSPMRSFLLPTWQLEGLGSKAWAGRVRLLMADGGGTAALLTLVGFLFQAFILFGVLGLLQMLVPKGVPLQLWQALDQAFGTPWFNALFTLLGLLALTATEPFYTAAGFALYLNRRTQLEGWDLEQAFRRLAERVRASLRVVLLLLALGGGTAWAQEAPSSTPALHELEEEEAEEAPKPPGPLLPQAPARKAVQELLDHDPELRRSQEVKVLKYRPTGKEPKWLRSLLDALFGETKQKSTELKVREEPAWWEALAAVMKGVLVAGLVSLVLFLVYKFHQKYTARGEEVDDFQIPEAVGGLDIRPESLPPDVAGEALRRFRQGDPRGALALLYRGALAALVHGFRVEIGASSTEGDCLRSATAVLEEGRFRTFSLLTTTWMTMAYQDLPPTEEVMDRLCTDWRQAFGGAP